MNPGDAGGTHSLLQGGVIGEALQALGDGHGVAHRHDVAFLPVSEEIFATRGCRTDHGAAAGERLGLYEGQALFDRG